MNRSQELNTAIAIGIIGVAVLVLFLGIDQLMEETS